MLKKIGVLTSGGDAPGMNAAVRAVVRVGLDKGLSVVGIYNGYAGLLNEDFVELDSRSVANIIQKGGTILRSSRSKEFMTEAGLNKAKTNLEKNAIDGLIVIGGNGTFLGAMDLGKIWPGQIVGIPGTIDNDLYGTDETIGYDTAINTAVEAIDKVRDTADAHERFFLIEVMGRDAGFIALAVGAAVGAEEVAIPEMKTDIKGMIQRLDAGRKRGKVSSIIVVAEGDEEGGAYEIARKIEQQCGQSYHVVVLGHIQRGGSPTARDRILGLKLGAYAIYSLIEGQSGVMVGELHGTLDAVPLEKAVTEKKGLDVFLYETFGALAK